MKITLFCGCQESENYWSGGNGGGCDEEDGGTSIAGSVFACDKR